MNKFLLSVLTGYTIISSSVFAMEESLEKGVFHGTKRTYEDLSLLSYEDLTKRGLIATDAFRESFTDWEKTEKEIFGLDKTVPLLPLENAYQKLDEFKNVSKQYMDILTGIEKAYTRKINIDFLQNKILKEE